MFAWDYVLGMIKAAYHNTGPILFFKCNIYEA